MKEARAMAGNLSRRQFVCKIAPAAAACAPGLEERMLVTWMRRPRRSEPPRQEAKERLPRGRIGKLEISRLILGGNLIGGFAHSRDLMYISALMKRYFTDEKVMETLRIAEENSINTVNTNPKATALIQRYRKERGGKIQWIVQAYPDDEGKNLDQIKQIIDSGADAVYVQGNNADRLVRKGSTLVGMVR